MTKFTIGTSDEDDSNDETARDLEKLFCPLTDTNGAPYDLTDKDMGYQGNNFVKICLLCIYEVVLQ